LRNALTAQDITCSAISWADNFGGKHYAKKWGVAFFVVVLVFCSCWAPENKPPTGPIPETVFLHFVAENNMASPVTIKIRHYYDLITGVSGNSQIIYSEWGEIELEAREIKNIGSDIWNEMTGFNLLNTEIIDEFEPHLLQELHSSFEIEIKTAGNTYYLAGYFTTDSLFNKSGLCAFFVMRDRYNKENWYCKISTIAQDAQIWEKPFVLPVKLTVLADGSYAFTHDTIVSRDGVHVWW
jgi:hypothetical protein